MAKAISRKQIERAYQLLETRGPARAYEYMERNGGETAFPLHLLTLLRQRLYSTRLLAHGRLQARAAPR